eukprot:5870397-Prymnesium_polylepis.1
MRREYAANLDAQRQLEDERVRSRALQRERDQAVRQAAWASAELRAGRTREAAQCNESRDA